MPTPSSAIPKSGLESQHAHELRQGQRFAFGANWGRFLNVLTEERVVEATKSLQRMLSSEHLSSKTFLDAGCGSGLFSLAARRLGAEVCSFDYDPQSVACTAELKRRYFTHDKGWSVLEGSLLDTRFLDSLGTFDVVYSWGVLHHTGAMWRALENVIPLTKPGGTLFVSIYNDQGLKSRLWRDIKKLYCSGIIGRYATLSLFIPYFALDMFAKDLVRGRNPIHTYYDYKTRRGMSRMHDWVDWLGGYPFEVARADEVFGFCKSRGFELIKLTTEVGLGCNEFVFKGPSIGQQ